MKSAQGDKTYTSPVRKLARFFEKSRNQWKAKCRVAKAKAKRLANRVHFLEGSRAHWKKRVKELEAELADVKAARQALEQEINALRKTLAETAIRPCAPEAFRQISPHHQYSIGHILLFVSLVLSAAASLRGAGSAMAILLAMLQLSPTSPSWSAGRLWLLRLGYYKLTRPKVHAEDWVWILDHTVQLGAEKCLLILGVRLSALPPVGQCLSHEDAEPIALLPVTHSNGTVVFQQLEATVETTGVPREIISDQGSDLRSGVEKFCQVHVETSSVYDIKHKTAAVLKHELEHDETWREFTQQAAQTRSRLQQTALAPLMPPSLRTQARYMNVDLLIEWGRHLLTYLDDQGHLGDPSADTPNAFDSKQVEEKLGWLREFRQPMGEWAELLQIVTTTETLVRQEGLSPGVHLKLEGRLPPRASTERAGRIRAGLLTFVAQEEAKARPNERLLGSSEVIESVFGKLKRLERDQAKSGFTGLILGVCAIVSTTTQEVVQRALEAAPTKQVLAWCKKNLGSSVQSRRRAFFTILDRTEQKPDRLWGPA